MKSKSVEAPTEQRAQQGRSLGRLVRRTRRPKHKMARISGGWNYRGYCVYRKCKGNAGCLWEMADDAGEWGWFFHTLAEFRRTCDRWERQRAKEANTPNDSYQPTPGNGAANQGEHPK